MLFEQRKLTDKSRAYYRNAVSAPTLMRLNNVGIVQTDRISGSSQFGGADNVNNLIFEAFQDYSDIRVYYMWALLRNYSDFTNCPCSSVDRAPAS